MRSWINTVFSTGDAGSAFLPGQQIETLLKSFQINRAEAEPTGGRGTKTQPKLRKSPSPASLWSGNWLLETLVIAICFAAYAGQIPPDVNESHYLTKAKHFWDPSYCRGDLFLSSSFSHWLFYVLFGWLTKFMSLVSFAWIGRITTWTLIAFAWQRLSHAVVPLRFMSLVSALMFLLLNDRFHLAGEWVVGGFEAKGLAYFFVLLGLSFAIRGNWKFAWPALGAASAFHVLVGAWAVVACLITWFSIHRKRASEESMFLDYWTMQLKSQTWPLLAGGSLAMIGVIPPLLADGNATGKAASVAHSIYVNERISHHLLFGNFPIWNVARFSLIVVFWVLLNRWLKARQDISPFVFNRKLEPIRYFAIGSLCISFCGLLLCGLAEQGGSYADASDNLLRFYWFRLADFAIPMATALGSCFVIGYWLEKSNDIYRRISSAVFCACILMAAGLMIAERYVIPMPTADARSLPQYPDNPARTLDTYKNWKKACLWIRDNTPVDSVFITPNQQQTFKWYAEREEIVAWKDIPQDSHSIVQWQDRLNIFFYPQQQSEFGILCYEDDQLASLAKEFGAGYVLLLQRDYEAVSEKPRFKLVYPERADDQSTFVILKFD
jgi:hypothetical protein